VVETAAGGPEDGQPIEAELVKGVLEGLVEIGSILVGTVDHPILPDEGADPGRDGVEIANNGRRPQTDSAEVVGSAVGGEQRIGGGGQRAQLPGPVDGTVGNEKGSGWRHLEDLNLSRAMHTRIRVSRGPGSNNRSERFLDPR